MRDVAAIDVGISISTTHCGVEQQKGVTLHSGLWMESVTGRRDDFFCSQMDRLNLGPGWLVGSGPDESAKCVCSSLLNQ